MDWLLLNKDTTLLEFRTKTDEFGDTLAEEIRWHSSLRPIGYKSLESFCMGGAPRSIVSTLNDCWSSTVAGRWMDFCTSAVRFPSTILFG